MDKIDVLSWTSHVHMKDSHFYNCTTKNIKYVDNYELIAVIKNRLFKILAHRKHVVRVKSIRIVTGRMLKLIVKSSIKKSILIMLTFSNK